MQHGTWISRSSAIVATACVLAVGVSTVADFEWSRAAAGFDWSRAVVDFDWGRAFADFDWGRGLVEFEWIRV